MGGRKGPPLKKIVGDTKKVRAGRKELLQAIQDKKLKKVVEATASLLGRSDEALESIAYGYLFGDSVSSEYKKLRKESTKKRRKELSKKWASFRKEKGKQFDPATNRDIVDSATRVWGGAK